MPYKNPEDKRKWEREHREQRNAQRRAVRLTGQARVNTNCASDPVPAKKAVSGWEILASIAVGIGVVLLTALAGVSGLNAGTSGSGK